MDAAEQPDMSNVTATDEPMPWFLKVVIAVAILVVLFVVGIDLLTFVEAL
jgi:hypothetical protein